MALTATGLKGLRSGKHGDGNGLYLQVRDASRSWLFRYKIGRKTNWMGLGGFDDVSLSEARGKARDARKIVLAGGNPIEVKRAAKADAEEARRRTFREVAEGYIAAHEAGWRNPKHKAQWRSTMEQHAYPVLGDMPVAAIKVADIMDVLQPIWHTTTETASRVRGRIESVLDHAAARGWRSGENPARWRGHLDKLLPARAKVARTEHHPALPWRRVGAFMAALETQNGIAAVALRFAVLTAARSGEVRGATWAEVDFAERLWTIEGARMKVGKPHRVALSDAAMAILRAMHEVRSGDLVFPSTRSGRPFSDMAMSAVVRRMNDVPAGEPVPWVDRAGKPIVPHGLRSCFRDWAGESTSYPRELAESALAHTLRDRVESAYARGDMIEKRRKMMADWATFCSRPAAPAGEVVAIRADG